MLDGRTSYILRHASVQVSIGVIVVADSSSVGKEMIVGGVSGGL